MRDFVKEAAAKKLGININEVTQRHILELEKSIYSIHDDPVESWDEYFFNVCRQAARNSKCLSRRIGSVLVQDKSIVSTGYNGPPRGIPSCDKRWTLDLKFREKYAHMLPDAIGNKTNGICPRKALAAKSGEMLDICIAGHAEENAILNAARNGIRTKGGTLYMTCGIPCSYCLIKIINAGIKEIVVTGLTFYDDNAEFLLNNSDVKVRLYEFGWPKN